MTRHAIVAVALLSLLACARVPMKPEPVKESSVPAVLAVSRSILAPTAKKHEEKVFETISLYAYSFDNDMDRIEDTDSPMFQKNVEAIKASPIPFVRVLGHTDARGSSKYNVLLALARAHALAGAYVEAGIPEHWIQVESAGETMPVCLEDTKECYARNRRVETYATVETSKKELITP